MTCTAPESTHADIEEENHRRLVAWFEEGARKSSTGNLGVEIEHFIVTDAGEPVSYEPSGHRIGVRDVLKHLAQFYPHPTRNERGDLLALANETGSVTLEPAAQIEISLAPYRSISDIESSYRAFRSALDPFLEENGCRIVEAGYHPTTCALGLTLIPKARYRFMDDHFRKLGTHGERMMRASASTQVSIDYEDEADAVRKLRIATALSPIFAAITDNTRVFEGVSTRSPLARMALWRDVDDSRCGTIPGIFEPTFGFDDYARWLESIPPIYVTRPAATCPDGPQTREFSTTPARIAYGDAPMSSHDVEHLLSMVWPDVRLKSFVEIRPADCMSAPCVYGYAALIKGLFYRAESLDAIEQLLDVRGGRWPLDDTSVDRAVRRIQSCGLQAEVYGRTLESWEALLFGIAEEALANMAKAGAEADERPYLDPLRAFATEKPWA